MSKAMDQPDWRDDPELSAQIHDMSREQRRQAAYFAIRRLQAPLRGIDMPADWGVDPAALAAVLDEGAACLRGGGNEGLSQAISNLCSAPLFESEIDPEFTESFQLEALNGWLMFAEAWDGMGELETERLVSLAREMASYLDSYMGESLTEVSGQDARERYLSGVSGRVGAYGLGYFGTRNLEVETRCHEQILTARKDAALALDSPVGQQLEADCDEFSDDLLSALREFGV